MADDLDPFGWVAARAGERRRDPLTLRPFDPGDLPGVVDSPRIIAPEIVVLEEDLIHHRPAAVAANVPDLGEPGGWTTQAW